MTCDDYLKDPEANAAHLETCAVCRVMLEELEDAVPVDPRPMNLETLPMAGWEGATYRTWPLVATGVISVLILAIVLFLAAGMPPLKGLATAVTSGVTSVEAVAKFFHLLGNGLHSAPTGVHVTVAVLFVLINLILVMLLRRAPKGIDV